MYLPPPPGYATSARLDWCDGTRTVDSESEPCARLCVAHYDGNRFDSWENESVQPGWEPWAPFPNEVLATPHLLPSTRLVRTWLTDADGGSSYRKIAMYETDLFWDQEGRPLRRWLVAVSDSSSFGHLVCAFQDELGALQWAAACAEE